MLKIRDTGAGGGVRIIDTGAGGGVRVSGPSGGGGGGGGPTSPQFEWTPFGGSKLSLTLNDTVWRPDLGTAIGRPIYLYESAAFASPIAAGGVFKVADWELAPRPTDSFDIGGFTLPSTLTQYLPFPESSTATITTSTPHDILLVDARLDNGSAGWQVFFVNVGLLPPAPTSTRTISVPSFGSVTLELMPWGGLDTGAWDPTETQYLVGAWSAWKPKLKVTSSPANFSGGKYLKVNTRQLAPIDQAGTLAGIAYGWTTKADNFVPSTLSSDLKSADGLTTAATVNVTDFPSGEAYLVVVGTPGGGVASADVATTEPGAILPGQLYMLRVDVQAYDSGDNQIGAIAVTVTLGTAPAAP